MRAAYGILLVTVLEESTLFCFFALWARVTGTGTGIECGAGSQAANALSFRSRTQYHARILHLSNNGEPLRIIVRLKSRIQSSSKGAA
jgi:hypothetical protein